MDTSRHTARQRALAVLFEADVRGRPPLEVLAAHEGGPEPPPAFAVEVVRGVADQRLQLDALISNHSEEWRMGRMPVVDRNVLRIGAWELLHTGVPTAVAIDEAVTLAKELSTEASGRFVNGVLGRLAEGRVGDGQIPANGEPQKHTGD